jgi:hypothetical protein
MQALAKEDKSKLVRVIRSGADGKISTVRIRATTTPVEGAKASATWAKATCTWSKATC